MRVMSKKFPSKMAAEKFRKQQQRAGMMASFPSKKNVVKYWSAKKK